MKNYRDVKPGDQVRVFDVNGDRVGQPAGGWEGTVVKAGPKLVTIDYPHGVTVFRRQEGRTNDSYGHQYFRTLEEAEEARRRGSAEAALRAAGVDVTHRCNLSTRRLEAMAAAATAPEPGES